MELHRLLIQLDVGLGKERHVAYLWGRKFLDRDARFNFARCMFIRHREMVQLCQSLRGISLHILPISYKRDIQVAFGN